MVNWGKVRRDMTRSSSIEATEADKKAFIAFDKDPCKMLEDGDIDQATFNAICEARGLRSDGQNRSARK